MPVYVTCGGLGHIKVLILHRQTLIRPAGLWNYDVMMNVIRVIDAIRMRAHALSRGLRKSGRFRCSDAINRTGGLRMSFIRDTYSTLKCERTIMFNRVQIITLHSATVPKWNTVYRQCFNQWRN